MKLLPTVALCLLLSSWLHAQTYYSKTGWVQFAGEKPFEKVTATDTVVHCSLDAATGEVQFHTLIRSFHFHIRKMEEKFNTDYMESDKYPNSTFNGVVTNINSVNFSEAGDYNVTVDGDLSMHNETKHVTHPAVLTVMPDGSVTARSDFTVTLDDFKVQPPKMFGHKMVDEISVAVRVTFLKNDSGVKPP